MNQPKKYLKTIKIALVVYLIVPFSCSIGDEPSCSGGGWTEETKVESIGLLVGSITQDRQFSGNQSTLYQNSVLSINVLELEYLAMKNSRPFTNSPFFISSAIASPGPTYTPTQTIESIQIYSDKQISTSLSDYESGEDISILFSIIPSNIDEEKKSFIDFLSDQKNGINVFGDYEHSIYLSLIEDTKIKDQSITVSITFDDESIVTASTSDFIIE
ncbi:MAG: hypothetical protein OCD76_04505 [Reichenbachiella sp.]